MRIPATIIVLAAVVACGSPVPHIKVQSSDRVQTVPDPVAAALRNVWAVTILRRLPGPPEVVQDFMATAFPVQHLDRELVLMTAAHVVRESEEKGEVVGIMARLNGKVLTARLLQIHGEQDAALISVPDADGQFKEMKVAKRIPMFGEIVYCAGYPAGMGRLFISSGIVSDPDLNTTLNYPGSSGSPVVDSSGQVVAMMNRIGVDRGTIITYTTFTVLMAHL